MQCKSANSGQLTLKVPELSILGHIAYSYKVSGGLRVNISREQLTKCNSSHEKWFPSEREVGFNLVMNGSSNEKRHNNLEIQQKPH